jgi:hypothetical protein
MGFYYDGTPSHTGAHAIEWPEENCDIPPDWPANSPNLPSIEMLCAILKQIMASMEPKTIEDLMTALING